MTPTQTNSKRVLMIVTSNLKLGNTGRSTGLWMEELAAPFNLFEEAGFEVTIASPMGGAAPVDEASLAEGFVTPDVVRFRANPVAAGRLAYTARLADMADTADTAGFDALFLVGGHGTMWDFVPNADLERLLESAQERGAVVSAVCHGVAGLLGAAKARFIEGRRLTGFSNEEEAAVGLTEVVPFLLQARLAAQGAMVETGPAFQPQVVVDGRLVTGQNPSSSRGVAQEVLRLLRDPT